MKLKMLRILRLIMLLAMIALTCNQATNSAQAIAWSELKEAIAETICVKQEQDAKDQVYYSIHVGWRKACDLPEPSTIPERAIQEAFASSGSLVISLRLNDKVNKQLSEIGSIDPNVVARKVFLHNNDFLRVIVPRISSALQAENLECSDCPTIGFPPPRKLSWEEFRPYFEAFIWPDEEKLVDGEWKHGLHTCLELNGLSELKVRDSQLERAGFVLAFDIPTVWEQAKNHMAFILKDPKLEKLQNAEQRTRFLRSKVPITVGSDPKVKESVCQMLQNYSKDLGIEISDCSSY